MQSVRHHAIQPLLFGGWELSSIGPLFRKFSRRHLDAEFGPRRYRRPPKWKQVLSSPRPGDGPRVRQS